MLLGLVACAPKAFAADTDLHGHTLVGTKPSPNAVVWVEASGAPRTRSARVVVDQRDLNFYPHVLAVRAGTVVDFPNNDRVFHNVFSFRDGRVFDLGMYPVGTVKKVTFEKPGLSRIFCNIHPNMSCYVMAVDSAFYAVSDKKGDFVINGVPDGTHKYHAWRPGGSVLNGTVTVRPGEPLEVRWP